MPDQNRAEDMAKRKEKEAKESRASADEMSAEEAKKKAKKSREEADSM